MGHRLGALGEFMFCPRLCPPACGTLQVPKLLVALVNATEGLLWEPKLSFKGKFDLMNREG